MQTTKEELIERIKREVPDDAKLILENHFGYAFYKKWDDKRGYFECSKEEADVVIFF